MRFHSIRARGFGPFREEVAVDFDALDGSLVALAGPNGAGKSTLLELLAGCLLRECPTRGSLASLATERGAYVEVRATGNDGRTWTVRQTCDSVSGKGETLILDEDGRPALASTKVSDGDRFIAAHFPAPEVLYSTTFSAQGAGGMLDATGGAAKAVVLRILGIERLERLAADARERARKARGEADTVAAALAEARRGGVTVDAAEHAHAESVLTRDVARAALVAADVDVKAAYAEAERVRVLVAEETERQRRMTAAQAAVDAARARIDDVDRRIANNRGVLDRRDDVLAAVARDAELAAEVTTADAEVARLRAVVVAEDMAALGAGRRQTAATARHDAAASRVKSALAQMCRRVEVEAAAADAVTAREHLTSQALFVAELEAEVAALQGRAVDGADARSTRLRGSLDEIVASEDTAELALIAIGAVEDDDRRLRTATETPAALREAHAKLAAARAALAQVQARVADLDRTAALAPTIVAAETDRTAATADMAAATVEVDAEHAAADAAHRQAVVAQQAAQAATTRARTAQDARTPLVPLVALAGPLATAEARIAELQPQRDAATAELQAAAATYRDAEGEQAPGYQLPGMPDVDTARIAYDVAVAAEARAAMGVQVAAHAVAAAKDAAHRAAGLEMQSVCAEEAAADWARLGADLGRDGLQAAEVDCAGPEWAELTNDLLHVCVGPRWTVTIATQRASADGKRTLEEFGISVLDTERGREADGRTLSGGERVLVNESLSLALTVLACRRAGIVGPTLVRDESGAALSLLRSPGSDVSPSRAYVAMLRRAAGVVGASKVLIVSHMPEVVALADERVWVADGRVTVGGEAPVGVVTGEA